jgi:phosphate uptake regulator
MVCTATSAQALGLLDPQDTRELIRMAAVLEKMLTHLRGAFSSRDIAKAAAVLPCDSEIDRLRIRFAKRHVAGSDNAQVLSMANWLQEAGNQAKAMAEEICHFASGNQAFQDLITRNKPVEREFLNWLRRGESSGCRSDLGSVRERTIRIQIQPRFRTSRGIAR